MKSARGLALTDLDAVAQRDNLILLVDAKAFQQSAGLAAGEYDAVSAARRKVDDAAHAWRDKIEVIRRQPSILGLTRAATLDIRGLVIIPFVPFTKSACSTDEVAPGLRRVSSVGELLLATTAGISWT